MIPAVRDSVRTMLPTAQHAAAPANLSLLFNRLCRGIDEPKTKERACKEETIAALVNGYSQDCYALYKDAFKRWQETLDHDDQTLCFEMMTSAPLVVGMGDQNVHEFGITLQPPWGTPVIPGSAVKGVLSTFAHEQGSVDWQKSVLAGFSGQHALIMFGGEDEQKNHHGGCLDFLDCWWVPRQRKPFAKDIITVHNPSYYRGSRDAWPDGTDDPNPVNFIVIPPGQCFLFAIRGTRSWCELARDMLKDAAAEYGFGAKTRVGYGRLKYRRSIEKIKDDLPDMKAAELLEVFEDGVYGQHPELQDGFREKAYTMDYSPELERFFRKFRPALPMLAALQGALLDNWRTIRNIWDIYRNSLPPESIKTTDPDVQEIFRLCVPHIPDNLPPEAWIYRFAPTAGDLIQGLDADGVLSLINEYEQDVPPIADFQQAINNSSLDGEDKELLLGELAAIMDGQP